MLAELVNTISSTIRINQQNGKYMIEELYLYKSALNDMRTMIFNNDDSIYFNKIHCIILKWLKNKDSELGIKLTITDNNGIDITEHFIKVLNSQHKIINKLVNSSDLPFLYNAVLQHTDNKDMKRFITEYSNGMIQCTIIKCYYLCPVFIKMLCYHRLIIGTLMNITPGGLSINKNA